MEVGENPSTSQEFSSEFETSLTLLKSLRESRFSLLATVLEAQIDHSGLVPNRLYPDGSFHKQSLKDYLRLRTLKPVLTVQSLANDKKWQTAHYQAMADQRNKETYNQASLLRRRALGQRVAPKFFHGLQDFFRYHYRIVGHAERTYNVRFDRTGQYIFTGSDDSLVKVWDMSQAVLRYTFRGASSVISDMDISFCNQFMVTAGSDKSVRIWDLQNGAMIQVYKSHSNSICSIYFLPKVFQDRRWIVSFGNDCNVIFYEFDGKQKQFEFRRVIFNVRTAPGLKVLSGTYSSCGDWVAAGDSHGYVHLFRFLEDNYHVDLDFKAIPAQEKLDTLEWAHSGIAFIACSSRHHVARIWRFINDNWHFLEFSPQLDESMTNVLHSTKLKYGINMAVWNLDDTKIIVSGTDFKIRIFDAVTAQEIYCLNGHKSYAYHLKIHPTHPNVVVSLGHDGLILIWDIEMGKQLNIFTNEASDDDGDVISSAILDCAFSPDSTTLAIVDDTGGLAVYGYGGNDHFMAPKEQFFSSDYSPTISDEDDFPIDVETGHPPHLSSPPWLIDARSNPLDEKWQKKVPGRERANNEVGELECAWTTRSIIPKLTEEISNQWVEKQLGLSVENNKNLSLYDSRFDQYKALGSEEPAPPKPTSSRRRTQLPTLDELVREQRERRLQINDYRSEDDEDYNASEEGEEQRPQADSEEDGEDTSDESYGSRNSQQREDNREQAAEEEEEVVRTSSGRQSRPPRPSVFVSDNRPVRRRNRRQAVEVEDHIEDESSRDIPEEETSVAGPSVKQPPKPVKEKKSKMDESLATFPLIMQEVRPKRFPYFPQIGDNVVYFRQGHQAYLDLCQLKNYYQITKKMQPPANAKAEEFCTVVEVKYTMKPYRLACVRLAQTGRHDDPTGVFFNVKFHDAEGSVDFIIFRQIYERALASGLTEGTEIEAIFDAKWYMGSLLRRADVDADYPGSSWNCMVLRWQNGDEERLSPWEIQKKTARRVNEDTVLEEELLITYEPSADDWPGTSHLPERNMQEHCKRLVAAINQLNGNATVAPFTNPVSLGDYPDYAQHVAYCIDLSTICQRLNNKFYRRLSAVQHDIRHIAVAAEQYNEVDSSILKNSRMLVEALIRFSNDTSIPVNDFEKYYDSMFDLPSEHVTAYRAPKSVPNELVEMAVALPAQEEVQNWKAEVKRILESVFGQPFAKPFYDKDEVRDDSIHTALNEKGDLKSVVDELDSFATPEDVIAKIRDITDECRDAAGRDGGQRRTHDCAVKVDKTVEQKMKAVVDKFKTCLANVELNGVSVRRNLRQRAPKQSTYQTRSHKLETSRSAVYYSEEPNTSRASAAEMRSARALRRTASGETSSSAARESTIEREIPHRRGSARSRAVRSSTESLPTSDAEEIPAPSARSRRRTTQRLQEELEDDLRDIREDEEERMDARETARRRKRKHSVSDSEGEYFSGSPIRSRPTRSSRRSARNRGETSDDGASSPAPMSVSSFGRIRRPRQLN